MSECWNPRGKDTRDEQLAAAREEIERLNRGNVAIDTWGLALVGKLGEFMQKVLDEGKPLTCAIEAKLGDEPRRVVWLWATLDETHPITRLAELAAAREKVERERDEKDAVCDRLRDKCNELTAARERAERESEELRAKNQRYADELDRVTATLVAANDKRHTAESERDEARKALAILWQHLRGDVRDVDRTYTVEELSSALSVAKRAAEGNYDPESARCGGGWRCRHGHWHAREGLSCCNDLPDDQDAAEEAHDE